MSEVPEPFSKPELLGDALEALMRHLGAPPVRIVTSLRTAWPDIVGPVLAANSRPAEVIDGELTVHCDDPAWASQIKWMETQIGQRCAQAFDGLRVDRIRVRIGQSRDG